MAAIRISPRIVALRGISAAVAFAGCFGLYYGMVMLFFVPGDIGESFFTVWRLTSGALPLLAGLLLVVFAARIWKYSSKTAFLVLVKHALFGAVAAVAVVWIALIIIGQVTHQIP